MEREKKGIESSRVDVLCVFHVSKVKFLDGFAKTLLSRCFFFSVGDFSTDLKFL